MPEAFFQGQIEGFSKVKEALHLEQLKIIRDRCNAATPGPWVASIEDRDHESGSNVIIRGVNGSEEDLYLIGGTLIDYDFIANARQDIPLLLEEIDRLKMLLDKCQGRKQYE